MNPSRGIALKIVSTFVFTLMLVCVKAVADRIPTGEIVFCRAFFALIPIVAMLAWQGQVVTAMRTERPWWHVLRSAAGLAGMAAGFISLRYLPLPEQMTIGYASPLIVVALAALFLGETVRVYRWSAVVVGFLGVVVILWPRFTLFVGGVGEGAFVGAVVALVGAFFSAGAAILIRKMVQTEATGTIVFYFALSGAVISLVVTLPFGWEVPSLSDAILLVSVGLLGGVGQILLTAAFRHADAATLASFEYASIVWGVVLGYLLFGEVPSGSVVAGGAVVVAAGIFIIWRERQLGMQRARQRKAGPTIPI